MPKNAYLCLRVVPDQLCNANDRPAHVKLDELAPLLSLEKSRICLMQNFSAIS